MQQSERVSLTLAAKELGVSMQSVREHMKRGVWDLGSVVTPKESGKSFYGYYIYRRKLDKFLGKEDKVT